MLSTLYLSQIEIAAATSMLLGTSVEMIPDHIVFTVQVVKGIPIKGLKDKSDSSQTCPVRLKGRRTYSIFAFRGAVLVVIYV